MLTAKRKVLTINRGDTIKSILLLTVLLLTSCKQMSRLKVTFADSGKSSIFYGIAPVFSGILFVDTNYQTFISSAYASSCAGEDVQAELYLINNLSTFSDAPLATAPLKNNGSFQFNFKELGLSLSDKVNYNVKIVGCDIVLMSPVLVLGETQLVDARSTFISASINSNLPIKLNETSRVDVISLNAKLNGASVKDVKVNLIANPSASSQYISIFGVSASTVDVAPVAGVVIPTQMIPENQAYQFKSIVEKIDSSYAIAYEWSLDNVVRATTADWSYTPGKNDQGPHQVTLKAGADNGSGGLDSTRPYFEKKFSIKMANTFLPVAPVLSVSSSHVNNSSITVDFDKSDCSTFSKVAITSKSSASSLSESDFSYTCLNSSIPYTLSVGDGLKTIFIYTKDAAGIISAPSTQTVTLDTQVPILSSGHSFFVGGGVYSGFINELISWTAVDANLGILPITINYSTDFGVTWNEIITNKSNDGMFSWNLPNSDLNEMRIQVIAEDLAGNKSIITSPLGFSVDSTPPLSLAFTIDQGALTNNTSVTATVANCSSDQKFMLMKEGNTTPLVNDALWVSCTSTAGSLNYDLSLINGLKTLYVWAKDLAGNISPLSSQTITLDSVAPVIALTSPAGGSYVNEANKSTFNFVGTCTEDGTIQISGDIVNSISCSGGVFNLALDLTSIADSYFNISLKMTDAAGNISNVINRSLIKDTIVPTLSISSPVSSSYIKNSITVTGTCSEENKNVHISGAISALVPCIVGAFSTVLNSASLGEGNVTLNFDHSDDAGNNAISVSKIIIKDTIAPILTQTSFQSGNFTNTNSITFGGVCENGASLIVSGDDSASVTCSGSAWSFTTDSKFIDGTYSYTFTHTDANGNISSLSSSWVRDTVTPIMQSVLVAEGAAYVGTSYVVVDVEASDDVLVKSIRLKNAHTVTKECHSEYADDNWQIYSGGLQRYSTPLIPGDGEKKICVWAKDNAGNVTVMSPVLGTLNINMDTVLYEIGNPPVITAFSVLSSLGEPEFALNEDVLINWTITDEEELSVNPVSLYYTTSSATNANWTLIATNYGNIGTGKTTSSGNYLSFKAPSAGFFRVKIVAKDIAGNTSLSTEKTLNTGNWSIFAGTLDPGVGGSALGVRLKSVSSNLTSMYAAINPKTNDAYVVSYGQGIYKLDAVSGKVEMFINHGIKNFSDGDTITTSTATPATEVKLMFDNNGLLYLIETSTLNAFDGSIIWQINPITKVIKKYLGGGSLYDGAITANTAQVQFGAFTFDESNSLYYLAHCSPGTYYNGVNPGTTALRLMKAFQDPTTKTVSGVNAVAGNCVRGVPTSSVGVTSLDAPLMDAGHTTLGGISALENGNKIYYYFLGANSGYKINNGITYKSSISGYPYYDYQSHKFYFTSSQIHEGVLNFNSSNGDTSSIYITNSGTGDCIKDGVNRTSACIATSYRPIRGPNGNLAFLDGALANSSSTFSVRYVDENNNIKTYLGTPPFYGDDLDKGFMKSEIGGIYYKKSSEANQGAFPEGLYFVDGSAMIMGHINTAQKVKIIAGNQSKASVSALDNTDFDTGLSLGTPYSYGAVMSSLAFNNEGLPFMRVASYAKSLMKIEADKKISFLTASTGIISNYFDFAVEGANPSLYGFYVAGGKNNLTIKDEKKVFLLGAYTNSISNPTILSSEMKLFDYENSSVRHLMGVSSSNPVTSPDDFTGGNLSNKTFPSDCTSTCFLQYNSSDDRLYFSEDKKIRYVTTPDNQLTRTLGTLFTSTRTIHNFIFSTDQKQVFYISNGKLYCKDISSGKAWCNDSELGPALGMSLIASGPNQLTWKDDLTLLVSTFTGMIYQYNLFL